MGAGGQEVGNEADLTGNVKAIQIVTCCIV